MKIRLVGAELFHVDGRTDRETDKQDKAKSRFSQFLQTRLERLAEAIFIKSNSVTFTNAYLFRLAPFQ
jgi:hypothetical protein